MSAKRVLFVTYGGGHAHMIYPVIRALERSGAPPHIHVLGLTTAKGILARNGVTSFGFARFLDPSKDRDAIAWGAELARIHHSPQSGIELEESIAYLGLSFKDLVERLGESGAQKALEEQGRHAFFPVGAMARVFDEVRPDFVVTTNSPRSEAAAIEVANRRGIGNLAITDLFSGIGGYQLQARDVTFLNSFAADMWLKDGLVDPAKSAFHITGNPAFDRLLELPTEPDPDWIESQFPGLVNRKLVLHADAPAYLDPVLKRAHYRTPEETFEEMDAVYQAALNNGATYLIRPHPSQPTPPYQRWMEGRPHAYLAASPELVSLLRNISLLVVRISTVGLEAAYLRKNILQLGADLHADMPLARLGLAWGANSYSGLDIAVRRAMSDIQEHQKIQQTIAESLPRESAAPKIAAVILKKLSQVRN